MLYQISDKTGKAFGVHECIPSEIAFYLARLPSQGSPYSVKAQTASLVPRAHVLVLRNRFAIGLLCGGGLTEGAHLLAQYLT